MNSSTLLLYIAKDVERIGRLFSAEKIMKEKRFKKASRSPRIINNFFVFALNLIPDFFVKTIDKIRKRKNTIVFEFEYALKKPMPRIFKMTSNGENNESNVKKSTIKTAKILLSINIFLVNS